MAIDSVTVGSVEIVSVSDGMMRGPPAFFFSGIPPQMYEAALGDDLKDGMIDVTFGSFVVRSSGKTVLVDTGAGTKNPGMQGGALLANLAKLGLQPGDIDVVVNTHLHVDHVGWNCSERDGKLAPTFPNAEYWIAQKEWDYWTDPEIVAEVGGYLTTDVLPLKDSPQLRLVDGEAAVTPELSLLPTPGHSSLAVASAGDARSSSATSRTTRCT